ncbi:MAG: hypothetical protein IKP28_05795 [Clostridia bacterium]|nr:hypothetical protein [Clostridia bacterium]
MKSTMCLDINNTMIYIICQEELDISIDNKYNSLHGGIKLCKKQKQKKG